MHPDNSASPAATMGSGPLKMSSDEINILIYLYLLESNFSHTAFSLLSESDLPSSPLFQRFNPSYPTPSSAKGSITSSRLNGTPKTVGSHLDGFGSFNGKVARGELIRKLWKALRWEEIEQHASKHADASPLVCRSTFNLLVPHLCSAEDSASDDPTMSPPPKRPEAFPARAPAPSKASEPAASEKHSSSRDRDTPPLAIGKGKRKGYAESSPPSKASTSRETRNSAIVHTPEPSIVASGLSASAQGDAPSVSDRGPAPKRVREDRAPSSELSKVKQANARSQESSRTKLGKSFPQQERGGGSWCEHRDAVNCVAWNPKDKEVLVTGSSDGTARLWNFMESDTKNHALQLVKKPLSISHKSIDTGKKAVTSLVWHPDGTVFATASDGVGRLFTPSGQLQGILTSGRGGINSLKFNPSGTSLLAAKDDFTVCLYILDFDLQQPKTISFEAHSNEVNDVDWLDDDVFVSGGNDHNIFVYRSNDRRSRFTFKGHTDDVTRVQWSPAQPGASAQDRLLASVSDDGTIMIWKLPHYPADRGTVSRSMSPSKQPREKELSAEEFPQVVVSPGSEHCVNRLVVVNGGTENKRMNTLEWSPSCRDGRMIVGAGGQDSTVKLFDALTGECLHVLSGLELGTGSLAFSPIGLGPRAAGLIAGGGWNGKLIVWDVATGQPVHESEIAEELERQSARDKPMMLSMAWRNDGQQLALGLHNKSLMTLFVGALL